MLSGFRGRRAAFETVAVAMVAGRLLHLQVQPVAGEGMGAGDVFVEVDAKAGGVGREDVAVLPFDRVPDQLLMKGAAGTAVQCANLMHGWDETAGLEFTGLHPI